MNSSFQEPAISLIAEFSLVIWLAYFNRVFRHEEIFENLGLLSSSAQMYAALQENLATLTPLFLKTFDTCALFSSRTPSSPSSQKKTRPIFAPFLAKLLKITTRVFNIGNNPQNKNNFLLINAVLAKLALEIPFEIVAKENVHLKQMIDKHEIFPELLEYLWWL